MGCSPRTKKQKDLRRLIRCRDEQTGCLSEQREEKGDQPVYESGPTPTGMSPTESNRVQQSSSPNGPNAPARVAGSQCPGYALRVSSQLKKRATACFSGAENSKTSKRVSVGRLVLKKKSECVEPASLLWDSDEVWWARNRDKGRWEGSLEEDEGAVLNYGLPPLLL